METLSFEHSLQFPRETGHENWMNSVISCAVAKRVRTRARLFCAGSSPENGNKYQFTPRSAGGALQLQPMILECRTLASPLGTCLPENHHCDICPSASDPKKGKGSPYSIAERTVPELIPVLGSQPARDVNHKPGAMLPLPSTRPAVTPATLKRAATNFAAW